MAAANGSFVEMAELLRKSGDRIAELLGVETAYVTSGGAAALALSAAACMAGADMEKIQRLPDATAMKNEIVIQQKQRYAFDHQYAIPGARLVEAGHGEGCTEQQLEAAFGPDTAAVAYFRMQQDEQSTVSLEKVVEIAHGRNVPVINDAAWMIYPIEFFRWNAQTPDLTCFGGKYLGAPHSTGFVCGRRDLIDAVAAQGFIDTRGTGRGMKVDRQEIVGLIAALERWLAMDHQARIEGYREQYAVIEAALRGVRGDACYLAASFAVIRLLSATLSLIPFAPHGVSTSGTRLRVDFSMRQQTQLR